MSLKDQLVRLGAREPDLRDHLRPVIDHLESTKEASSDVHEEFKEHLRAISKSLMYERANSTANEILDFLRGKRSFRWSDELQGRVNQLLFDLEHEEEEVQDTSDYIMKAQGHRSYLKDLADDLKEYTQDQRRKDLERRFRLALDHLDVSRDGADIIESNERTLRGEYKSGVVTKEFTRQTRRQWDKAFSNAEKEIEKLVKSYDDMIDDYSFGKGDKNWVTVYLDLKN